MKELLKDHIADIKSKVGAFKLQFTDARPEQGTFDSEAVARVKGQNMEIFLTKVA